MCKRISLLGLALSLLILPSAGLAQQPVRWEVTLDNAQRVAGQTNRLVLIEFWATWCDYCKRMDTEVFNQPSVAAEISANYVAVKVNADHFPATAKQYGVTALPTTVIITPQGQAIDSMKGKIEVAEYVARLSRASLDLKPRGGPVYAQVSSAATLPVATQPQATQPAAVPPATTQPAPTQPATTQPVPTATTVTGLSDDRYANYFQRSPMTASTPAGQPASVPTSQPVAVPAGLAAAQPSPYLGQPATAFGQLPTGYPQSPSIASSATPMANSLPSPTGTSQPYPVSQPSMNSPPAATQPPMTAAIEPARSVQSPQPPINRPTTPASAVAIAPPPAGNPAWGLEGFCPVTLVEKQQWVLGDRRFGAVHRGRTYLFTGAEEQRRFLADPDRYAPVASGNDIVLATEQGQSVPGMRQHGVFFGNRIYLFSDEATLERFSKNPNSYANQALEALRSGAYPSRQLR
jgi:thiol-disulfide isomerase/thioredoxin/YHS domain-containing protein